MTWQSAICAMLRLTEGTVDHGKFTKLILFVRIDTIVKWAQKILNHLDSLVNLISIKTLNKHMKVIVKVILIAAIPTTAALLDTSFTPNAYLGARL